MPRPRTATKILELKGSFKKHPDRKRPAEPKPSEPLGPPPPHLDDDTKAVWQELVEIIPPGVLWSSDRLMLEITCSLLVEYRRDPAGFQTSRLSQLRGCLGSLGLSPADRSKVSVPDAKKTDDPWDGFRKP